MFKKIIVPVDGSETCFKIYEVVQKFYNTYDAVAVLVNVDETRLIQNYVSYPAPGLAVQVDGAERSAKILEEACKNLDIPDTHLKLVSRSGDPASTIIEVADEENADMIIICTHGLGAMKRFLLGSVTDKVVHHAKVPVLIMRDCPIEDEIE